MVIVLDAQLADTPAGKPVTVPIPVAPVVAMVMLVKAVFIQSVGLVLGAAAVLFGVIFTTATLELTDEQLFPAAETIQ